MLQYHFTWKTLSVMAGITFWNFSFPAVSRRHPQPAYHPVSRAPAARYPGKPLIVWDGPPAHRSCACGSSGNRGTPLAGVSSGLRAGTESLRYIWGHLKQHEIAILCPKHSGQLSLHAIRALKMNAPPPDPDRGLLAAGRPVPMGTILRNAQ